MDVCDPDADIKNLREQVKLDTGKDLRLTREQICGVQKNIQAGRLPLPPMLLNRSRKTLTMTDKKSPLTARDFERLFDENTTLDRMQRIARKAGLKVDNKSKADLVSGVKDRMVKLKVAEPVRITKKRILAAKAAQSKGFLSGVVNRFTTATKKNSANGNVNTTNANRTNNANRTTNANRTNNANRNNANRNNANRNNLGNTSRANNNNPGNTSRANNNVGNRNRNNGVRFPKGSIFRGQPKPAFLGEGGRRRRDVNNNTAMNMGNRGNVGNNRPDARPRERLGRVMGRNQPKFLRPGGGRGILSGIFGGGGRRQEIGPRNDFIPAKKFNAAKIPPGYVFKTGNQGTGYYPNRPPRRVNNNRLNNNNRRDGRSGRSGRNGRNGRNGRSGRNGLNGRNGGGSGGGGGGSGGGGANANALKMNRNRLQKERNELQKKLMRNKFKSSAEKVMAKKKFNKIQAEWKAAFLKERAELQKKINNAPNAVERNKLKANLLKMSNEMTNVIGKKNKVIEEKERAIAEVQEKLAMNRFKTIEEREKAKNERNKLQKDLTFMQELVEVQNILFNDLGNKLKNANTKLGNKNVELQEKNAALIGAAFNAERNRQATNASLGELIRAKTKQNAKVKNLQNKLQNANLTKEERNKLRTKLNNAESERKRLKEKSNENRKELEKLAVEGSKKNANKEAALAAQAKAEQNLANAKKNAENKLANAQQEARNAATKEAQMAARKNIEAAQAALKLAQEQVNRQTKNMKNKNKKLSIAEMNRNIAQGVANRKNKNKQNALRQQKEALNAQLKNAESKARNAGGAAAKANANAKIEEIKANLEKVKTNALNQQKATMNENLKRQLAARNENLKRQLNNAESKARNAGGANAKAKANAEIKNIKAKLEKVKTNALRQQKAAMTIQGAFKRAKNRKNVKARAYNQGKIDGRANTINNPLYVNAARKAANKGNKATQKAANNLQETMKSIKRLPQKKVSFGVNNPRTPGAGPEVNAEGFTKVNSRKARRRTNSNRKAINQAGINQAQNFKTIISKLQPRNYKPGGSKFKRAGKQVQAGRVLTNARLAAKQKANSNRLKGLTGANRVRESRRQAANKERQGGKEQKQVAGLFKVGGKKVNANPKRMMNKRAANRDVKIGKVQAQLESGEARKQAEEAQRKALDKKKKELTKLAMSGDVLTKTPSNFNNQNFRNVISKLTVNNLEVMVNRESDVNAEPFVDQVKNDIKEKITAKKPTKIPITNSNSNSKANESLSTKKDKFKKEVQGKMGKLIGDWAGAIKAAKSEPELQELRTKLNEKDRYHKVIEKIEDGKFGLLKKKGHLRAVWRLNETVEERMRLVQVNLNSKKKKRERNANANDDNNRGGKRRKTENTRQMPMGGGVPTTRQAKEAKAVGARAKVVEEQLKTVRERKAPSEYEKKMAQNKKNRYAKNRRALLAPATDEEKAKAKAKKTNKVEPQPQRQSRRLAGAAPELNPNNAAKEAKAKKNAAKKTKKAEPNSAPAFVPNARQRVRAKSAPPGGAVAAPGPRQSGRQRKKPQRFGFNKNTPRGRPSTKNTPISTQKRAASAPKNLKPAGAKKKQKQVTKKRNTAAQASAKKEVRERDRATRVEEAKRRNKHAAAQGRGPATRSTTQQRQRTPSPPKLRRNPPRGRK